MPAHDEVMPPNTATAPEVAIAGAGPSGLMLACELALAGIRTVVLEPRSEPSSEPPSSELPGQIVRMLDHRGLYGRLADVPGSRVPQATLVTLLATRAAELEVEVRRGHELVDLEQDDVAVTVEVTGPDGPYRLRADYLVGANENTRIAERLRDGRVFRIGAAAAASGATRGGPSLDVGVADAMNLGWKLAAAVLGDADGDLLASYERERRPAAEPTTADARTDTDAKSTAETDASYDMGSEQTGDLVGRLAPEMTLQTPGGPVRLAELTTRALPLLVDLTDQGTLATAIAPWHDEVDVLRARPGAGVTPTTALFLRPDCVVAWSSTSSEPGPTERHALRVAAERWLGPGRG